MKKILLIGALALALISCSLFNSSTVQAGISTHYIEGGPGAVLGSSAEITSFLSDPPDFCRYQVTTAGPKHALACKTPAKVTLTTVGYVTIRMLSKAP